MSRRSVTAALTIAAMTAAAAPARAADVEKLAVLVLGATANDKEVADNLTEVVIARVARRGAVELVGTDEFRRRMSVADDRQALACLELPTCVDRVAVSLGVKRIVSGSVSVRSANQYAFGLSVRNAETGALENRTFRMVDGPIEELIRSVQRSTDALFERPPEPGRVSVETETPASRVYIDDAFVGLTPVLATNLLAGRHELRVEHAGRFPWSSELTMQPGGNLDFHLTDSSMPRRLVWPTFAAWGTATGAALALTAGAVLGIMANVEPTVSSRKEAQRDFERRETMGTSATVLLGTGAALAITSAVLFWRYRQHIFAGANASR